MKVKMILPALTEALSPYWRPMLEPLWDGIIRAKRATRMLPVLETVLSGFGTHAPNQKLAIRHDEPVGEPTAEVLV